MITDINTAVETNTAVQNPLGLKKIHHVEFYVGNAKQAEFYYRKAFGFSRAGYSGLETGNRETTSYLMRQTNINFVLTTPLNPEHPAAEHIKQHGDGVHDIAFLVEDADHAFHEAVRRGATPVEEPHDHGDEHGVVRHASIATYGDTIHSFLSYNNNNGHNYNGVFLPGMRVNLDCSDGTPRTVETYWDQYTAPDDILVENFVISDLPMGTCRVWAETPGGLVQQSIEILPGELSGVVLQLRP